MILEKLSLINFKNYDEAQVDFCKKFNCFVGNNGMGKTNLLDAIHYISFVKVFLMLLIVKISNTIYHFLQFKLGLIKMEKRTKYFVV
jgi:recombinational DNA repair ATPase RecF